MAAPPTQWPVQCQFADRTLSVPQYSTPVAPTGLTAYAAGDPLAGLHLELRLPRTTFVAGAVIQPEVAMRNTGASDAAIYASVLAMPPSGPADPRSIPIFSGGGGPMPGGRPQLIVPPGQTRTMSLIIQLPFDASQAVHVHGSVAVGATTVTADVPLKLTTAGPAQQLKIELHADKSQWCARATDTNGRTPSGPLLAAVTARSPNFSLGGGTSSAASDAVWAGRFPLNPSVSGPVTVSVFVGGQNYETAKAETTVSP